jgi:pimeloyl-ACP methyl ester carboxylesterase
MDYDAFEDGFTYTSLGEIHFKHHPGTGEKLIFLHGLGGTTLVWKRLMGLLPGDLDIYLVDLLGHGQSAAPDVDYTVSVQFQALREFISLQNNGYSYIFGHSYGAWVAAYYASQPCTCKGLILEDSPGLKEIFDDIHTTGILESMQEQLLRVALEMGNKEEVMRSIIYANFDEDQLTTEVLSNIKQQTLILWGANDEMTPLKYGMILQSKIKGSQLEIIDGAGHDAHYEQPEKVRNAILKFIGHNP